MKKMIFIILILAIISSGFYYFLVNNAQNNNENDAEGLISLATTTEQALNATSSNTYDLGGLQYQIVDSLSTSTIEKLNLETLKRELNFPSNNPVELNKKYETDIRKIISDLKDKPEIFDKWIDLGVYRKTIGDYVGAKEAWENASIIRPREALPVSNIGNLLGYYMKDPVSAEKYYLRSIEIEPSVGFWYYQTFMFYKEVMKDDSKAKLVLEKGVIANPNDLELKAILENL